MHSCTVHNICWWTTREILTNDVPRDPVDATARHVAFEPHPDLQLFLEARLASALHFPPRSSTLWLSQVFSWNFLSCNLSKILLWIALKYFLQGNAWVLVMDSTPTDRNPKNQNHTIILFLCWSRTGEDNRNLNPFDFTTKESQQVFLSYQYPVNGRHEWSSAKRSLTL